MVMKRRGDISVKVLKVKGRKCFLFRWVDPLTGRNREQTSDVPSKRSLRRVAERRAVELEQELRRKAVGIHARQVTDERVDDHRVEVTFDQSLLHRKADTHPGGQ